MSVESILMWEKNNTLILKKYEMVMDGTTEHIMFISFFKWISYNDFFLKVVRPLE